MRATFPIVLLAMFLAACNKDENKFPGFTAVGVPGQEVVYLYETSSIDKLSPAYQEGRYSAFTMIKKLKDGYVIQSARTDCVDHISTKDGYFYAYKDEIRKEYPGSGNPIAIGSDPHLRMLLKAVCVKKEHATFDEIAGNQDDILIIAHKKKVTGFLTKDSKASRSIKADKRNAVILIKKGVEVLVTGVSNDGKWIEVEYKVDKNLLVPADNVATFSD